MLTSLLIIICFAQGPQSAEGPGPFPIDAPGPAPLVVRGTVELTPAAADAAAVALVEERARNLLEDRGRGLMARVAPCWLPSFCRDQVLRRWLVGCDPETTLRVVDRQRLDHDHGSLGTSYRTALVVESDEQTLGKHLSRLRRQVPRAAETFAIKCGAIAGFWALLGLAIGWLDRLSRGYMTWRLRMLGLLAGSVAPGVALFLV